MLLTMDYLRAARSGIRAWGGPARSCRHRKTVATKHLPDPAHRLPRARAVLDQREPHVVVAVFAEADAGRYGHLGPLDQLLREFERAAGAIALGNLRPHVHRSLGVCDGPTRLVQPFHQHVAAPL